MCGAHHTLKYCHEMSDEEWLGLGPQDSAAAGDIPRSEMTKCNDCGITSYSVKSGCNNCRCIKLDAAHNEKKAAPSA